MNGYLLYTILVTVKVHTTKQFMGSHSAVVTFNIDYPHETETPTT